MCLLCTILLGCLSYSFVSRAECWQVIINYDQNNDGFTEGNGFRKIPYGWELTNAYKTLNKTYNLYGANHMVVGTMKSVNGDVQKDWTSAIHVKVDDLWICNMYQKHSSFEFFDSYGNALFPIGCSMGAGCAGNRKITIEGYDVQLYYLAIRFDSCSYGSWTTYQAATCVAGGSEYCQCIHCGAQQWRATPPNPNNHTWSDKNDFGNGYSGQTCIGCGAVQNKTANVYTVNLDHQNGEENTQINCTFDAMVPNVPVPHKDGHSFLGYFDAPDGDIQYIDSSGHGIVPWTRTD